MPFFDFRQGTVICGEGEPLRTLSFITKGGVEASFYGHKSPLEKGNMIGLCDLGGGIHTQVYTAVSDTTIFSYNYDNLNDLETLLRDNADTANLIVNSMCFQISERLQYRDALKREAAEVYALVKDIYPQYEDLCRKYALTPKKIQGLSAIGPFSGTDPLEDWMHDYYMEAKNLTPAARKGFFYNNPGISSAFIRRGAEDILLANRDCELYREYITGIAPYFISSGGHDLFALISELHFNAVHIEGADAAAETLITPLTGLLSCMTGIDAAHYQKRLSSYKDELVVRRASKDTKDAPAASGVKQNLADSLDIILDYSECPEDMRHKFTRHVKEFRDLPDRSVSDDAARRQRKETGEAFYELYQKVFFKCLNDPSPSTIIKMFLNFGYVDAELAGQENADYLYSVADSLIGDPSRGVYTLREWLAAVYNGDKEPSRNEFDMDYTAYIHEMKVSGKIDAKEEARLAEDAEGKLRFEIENVFPIVNKLTSGRITTFCPLFSDHCVQRRLEMSLVSPELLGETIDEIRGIDFSAYCRETVYTDPKGTLPNEFVHTEMLPDFILTPNVGMRGVMWQETGGRKRATPARIFMPMFLEVDLKTLTIRLTGELRWEICKRVQGARWNDLSTPSLTSVFCDYLQFYRANRALSPEAKEDIKADLTRAGNNYRTVFVSNYTEWLLYESNGSPRLNKVALAAFVTFCPFSAAIREKLLQNPRYFELFNRYNNKQQQRVQHLSRLIHKIGQMGRETPQEILDEMEYAKG